MLITKSRSSLHGRYWLADRAVEADDSPRAVSLLVYSGSLFRFLIRHLCFRRPNVTTEPRRTSSTRRRLQLKLDVVVRSRILALPGFSSFAALPDNRSGEGVDPDPRQRPIAFARREEVIQSLTSKLLGNKQLRRPSLERLASEIDLGRRRPARNTTEQEVAPRLLIFVALDDESMAFVPLDVKKRELFVGGCDRSTVPDRTRPKAREDLRDGRNRERCLARDEREPKRVLEIDAHASGFFGASSPDARIIAVGAENGPAIHGRIPESA
jgi:hypothetical protein